MKLICLIGLLLLVGCAVEIEETTENITEEINIEAEQQREQQNQKIIDKESLCIERIKLLIPENITLRVDNYLEKLQYVSSDTISGGHCDIRKGKLVGENINKYYGGCQIRFYSGINIAPFYSDVNIADTGDILPVVSFSIDVGLDDLIHIPENDRLYEEECKDWTCRGKDTPLLKDFKIDKFDWISCSGADSIFYTNFCINNCKRFDETYENLFFNSDGTFSCSCV